MSMSLYIEKELVYGVLEVKRYVSGLSDEESKPIASPIILTELNQSGVGMLKHPTLKFYYEQAEA